MELSNSVINVSCNNPMNLAITYGTPDNPDDGGNSWLYSWYFDIYIDGEYLTTLEDDGSDGDLRGFHDEIPASELPGVNYTWYIDVRYGTGEAEETFPMAFSGEVICTQEVTPAEPTFTDPCGPDNAYWTVPEPGEGYTYEESTDGDLLVVTAYASDGYSFADNATTMTWSAADSGEECPTTPTPEPTETSTSTPEPTTSPTDDTDTDTGVIDDSTGASPVPTTPLYAG
ncbi:hypothetical protein QQX09_05940 [Demequina sp. SYSU T00192]|uniref:Uncharacterized protein n=1 Tax=Demequina litoralis TaxID=3051660 RepID=A0ABT8G8E1_9MICO|nr:hypothetical protein [Demequina sp. SYSU T00192]MDN4475396.1 hypothetical protein [Demequina sp. SYSU T00192]